MRASTTSASSVPVLKPNDPCWCGSGQKFKRCHKASTERLRPGRLSPTRAVPDSIARPPYATTPLVDHPRPPYLGTGDPPVTHEPLVKPPEVIERMRRAGRAAAEVLGEAGAAVAAGVTTDELDELVHEACIARGGYPSPLGYRGYPKSVCSSVNEVICHGIPDDRALVDGDVVDLDVTIYLDGVHGDTNATFLVGTVDEASRRLVAVTRECMRAGIAAVAPGRPVSDIGRAIEAVAHEAGYSVVRAFIGHAIGESFHGDLVVPHYFEPRASTVMETGMTFTIEPMIAMGSGDHEVWNDGWTAVTPDRSRVAQFEHTLVVTDDGAEVLTVRADGSSAEADVVALLATLDDSPSS
jgi:methionyl aminopeptidase